MYMGRVGSSSESEIVRELHGARVVLTGLSATSGVDVVRAFADIKARLVIHTTDLSPEVTALIALVSQTASEIKLYTDPLADADAAVRFAQGAAKAYGGLDAVINLASISAADMTGIASEDSVSSGVLEADATRPPDRRHRQPDAGRAQRGDDPQCPDVAPRPQWP